jgi:hypothetical protein
MFNAMVFMHTEAQVRAGRLSPELDDLPRSRWLDGLIPGDGSWQVVIPPLSEAVRNETFGNLYEGKKRTIKVEEPTPPSAFGERRKTGIRLGGRRVTDGAY